MKRIVSSICLALLGATFAFGVQAGTAVVNQYSNTIVKGGTGPHTCSSKLGTFIYPASNTNGFLACCPPSQKTLPCNTPFTRAGLGPGNDWGGCGTPANVIIINQEAHTCVS